MHYEVGHTVCSAEAICIIYLFEDVVLKNNKVLNANGFVHFAANPFK